MVGSSLSTKHSVIHHIPEERIPYPHHCGNQKSDKKTLFCVVAVDGEWSRLLNAVNFGISHFIRP
jgi:hypothetical protein